MTQADMATAQPKRLTLEPLYSVEQARKKFQNLYLERADVKETLQVSHKPVSG